MIKLKYLIIFYVLLINLFIYTNEKKQFINNLSFQHHNQNKLSKLDNYNNDLIEYYNKKVKFYLGMGITGTIFTSLSVVSSITGTILFWNYFPGVAYTLFILLPIAFLLPFLAIGLPLLLVGFINSNRFRKKLKKMKTLSLIRIDQNRNFNIGLSFNY